MKSTFKISLVVGFLAAVAGACERKEPEQVGGPGGNAVLRLVPKHHDSLIDSTKVYIKYNASDEPAFYDDSVWCVQENGVPVATFSGLRKGNYYLYARGFDPDVPITPGVWWNSDGGFSHTIETEQTYNLTISISEAH